MSAIALVACGDPKPVHLGVYDIQVKPNDAIGQQVMRQTEDVLRTRGATISPQEKRILSITYKNGTKRGLSDNKFLLMTLAADPDGAFPEIQGYAEENTFTTWNTLARIAANNLGDKLADIQAKLPVAMAKASPPTPKPQQPETTSLYEK